MTPVALATAVVTVVLVAIAAPAAPVPIAVAAALVALAAKEVPWITLFQGGFRMTQLRNSCPCWHTSLQ